MPRKPRKSSEYLQFEAEWERRRTDPDRGAANWLVEPAGLAVDAVALMTTLRVLRDITQDARFDAARAAVVAAGLVDADGKWKRPAMLASEPARAICESIEEAIAAGVHERPAVAEAVVELNIEAASFKAAWQRVKRLLDEYRKSVTHKAP